MAEVVDCGCRRRLMADGARSEKFLARALFLVFGGKTIGRSPLTKMCPKDTSQLDECGEAASTILTAKRPSPTTCDDGRSITDATCVNKLIILFTSYLIELLT